MRFFVLKPINWQAEQCFSVRRPGPEGWKGLVLNSGLLAFDERSLEAMRQLMEEHVVTISRASSMLTFPANFQLSLP